MWNRIARLFVIKTKFEAFLVIYGLATGAVERGIHYLHQFPGRADGCCSPCARSRWFMAGGRILDSIDAGP